MKLIIDVGNTRIVFALFKQSKLHKKLSIKEAGVDFSNSFSSILESFIGENSFDSCYLSSVVPSITNSIRDYLKVKYPSVKIVEILPSLETNLVYKVDNPKEIGADLLADLAIGKEKYGYPCLIADLGTASKILLLDKTGTFVSSSKMNSHP
mgnify:CR=1 FL=1